MEERNDEIVAGLKVRQQQKDKLEAEALSGRVRIGKKLGKKIYKFR